MTDSRSHNRLARCTSPYLLQHADNPVDWYPWGPEALERASREDRPILLSIGYSACHWCHVMAHESFEDPETAALMNAHFVNIKVDREERPDLDRIYQTAHQLLTGRPGGWPLTMFLDPQTRLPYFGGTYFPVVGGRGLPGFRLVLERVSAAYREQRDQVGRQNAGMRDALARLAAAPGGAGTRLDSAPLAEARKALEASFDAQRGGFGKAPKFPQPVLLQRLMRAYAAGDDRDALHMACLSLRRMALGGLYDQIGGGFSRYSTDDYWMIPHFEKMLSDNGLLLALYADAWQATGDPFYARIARETGDWALTEMRDPAGAFQAALDADSEGGEGRFYTWTPDEVARHLDGDELALARQRFGLDDQPNFEGRWHFHVYASLSELSKTLRRPRTEVEALLGNVRERLYRARSRREWPQRDGKVLTAWNALMIRGLARAGRLLEAEEMVAAASEALDFLRAELWRDGRLLASWKDGRAELPAYLDDHAYLLDAVLELLQCRWRNAELDFARELADALLTRFQDREAGGFFLTADDHETLIQRPRPLADDACPSGNGVAALALQRLGYLLGDSACLDAAERTLRAAWGALVEMPQAHTALLDALDEYLRPPVVVMLRVPAPELAAWRAEAERYYDPRRLVFPVDDEVSLPPPLDDRQAVSGGRAWVCSGSHCLAPADSPQALRDRLDGLRRGESPTADGE